MLFHLHHSYFIYVNTNFQGDIYKEGVNIQRFFVVVKETYIQCFTDSDVKTGENSSYQEFDLSRELPYENTVMR